MLCETLLLNTTLILWSHQIVPSQSSSIRWLRSDEVRNENWVLNQPFVLPTRAFVVDEYSACFFTYLSVSICYCAKPLRMSIVSAALKLKSPKRALKYLYD
jgi:hypothetical protein